MSREIDGKPRRYVAGIIFVIVRECRKFLRRAESLVHIRLRQIAPLVLRQRIRAACRIRRRDRRMVLCGGLGIAALAARGKGDVLVRGGGGQPLGEGKLARELAVGMALVGELLCERVQHGMLIAAYNTVVVSEKGHDVLCADRLVYDDVAALHCGRRRCIMLIDDGRMSAVLVNVERLLVLLVDDAVRRRRVAAVEMRDARLRRVLAARDRTRANIFNVLAVALVAALVDPLRAVLQVEVCLAATVNKAVQIGLVRQQSRLQLARGQRKEIAVELHVGDVAACLFVAGLCAILPHIHGDLALISGKRIVAVFHPCRHLNGATARNTHRAVFRIRRDTVAVDGQIDVAARLSSIPLGYKHLRFFDLREDAGVVEAREDVLAVERDTPLARIRARNLEVAVDLDRGYLRCLVGLLAVAIALLHGDAIAAKPARHGNVQRGVEGDLRFFILCRIKLHGVRQRIAAFASARDDIDFFAVYDDVLAIARVDARRIADRVFHLQLQSKGEFPKIETRRAGVGDSGKHIGLFVAKLTCADIDEFVRCPILGRTRRNRIRIVAARLPDGVRVQSGRRRRAADLCGRREVDCGTRASHMVGGEHRHARQIGSGTVRGEVLRLPCLLGCGIAVGVNLEICTVGEPKALRIILGVHPTVCLSDGCGSVRCI